MAEYPDVPEDDETPESDTPTPRLDNALGRRRAPTRGTSLLDDVANDLAIWIDQTATEVALAFSPQRAPFSAQITEEQKLEFYKNQIFNPDGSPNQSGRQQQIARLGAEGFGQVYKAVVAAYPELKPSPLAMPSPGEGPVGPPAAEGLPLGPGPMMPPGAPPGAGLPVGGMAPPGPPPPIPMMAQGGIVTEPTLAIIGEAGPEVVVPLSNYQPPPYRPPDPDLAARLSGNAVPPPEQLPPGASNPNASRQDIEAYIIQAARQRGIDPNIALRVAMHEGLEEGQAAAEGSFETGKSWWPYQLHYGGKGYEQWGNVAGLGNDFTQATGWQPGDPRAWQPATDFALDTAIQRGWGPTTFYGAAKAGVGNRQGLPPPRRA